MNSSEIEGWKSLAAIFKTTGRRCHAPMGTQCMIALHRLTGGAQSGPPWHLNLPQRRLRKQGFGTGSFRPLKMNHLAELVRCLQQHRGRSWNDSSPSNSFAKSTIAADRPPTAKSMRAAWRFAKWAAPAGSRSATPWLGKSSWKRPDVPHRRFETCGGLCLRVSAACLTIPLFQRVAQCVRAFPIIGTFR